MTQISIQDELVNALRDWLSYAVDNLSEFDSDHPCELDSSCPRCRRSGCINRKILNARAAIDRAEGRTP